VLLTIVFSSKWTSAGMGDVYTDTAVGMVVLEDGGEGAEWS
jgi:hypothetical protein